MKKIGAISMATGLSSRMGEFKPMLPPGDSTIILYMVTMLKRLGVSPLMAVTGYRVRGLEERLLHAGVRFVRNERFREAQILDSARLGIEAAVKECGRIMVLPMGVPAIMSDTICRVSMIDGGIVQTICRGEPGHLITFQSRIVEQLCICRGGGGFRGATKDSDGGTTDLEAEDEGIYRDMDIGEEYRELVEWSYKRGRGHPTTPLVQVRLKAGDVFSGPGIERPLDMIYQTGSVQEARCRIGLSCSKDNRMVQEVERQLGIPMVECRAGGMGGGGSSLTDGGRKLIDSYARMVAEARRSTEQTFFKYFGKGISS